MNTLHFFSNLCKYKRFFPRSENVSTVPNTAQSVQRTFIRVGVLMSYGSTSNAPFSQETLFYTRKSTGVCT